MTHFKLKISFLTAALLFTLGCAHVPNERFKSESTSPLNVQYVNIDDNFGSFARKLLTEDHLVRTNVISRDKDSSNKFLIRFHPCEPKSPKNGWTALRALATLATISLFPYWEKYQCQADLYEAESQKHLGTVATEFTLFIAVWTLSTTTAHQDIEIKLVMAQKLLEPLAQKQKP